MGQGDSKHSNESVVSQFQLLSTEDDPRFGDIQIYRNPKTSEIFWVKEVIMEDEKSYKFYEEYINELHEQRRKSGKTGESLLGEESDIFITKNVEIFGGDSGGICGSCNQGKGIRVIMEFMERDLEGEI